MSVKKVVLLNTQCCLRLSNPHHSAKLEDAFSVLPTDLRPILPKVCRYGPLAYHSRVITWFCYPTRQISINTPLFFVTRQICFYCFNINWRNVKTCVINNEDMSVLRAPRQNAPYINTHLEQHEPCRILRRNRHSEHIFLCFDMFHFYLYFISIKMIFSKKCWVTALERPLTYIGH